VDMGRVRCASGGDADGRHPLRDQVDKARPDVEGVSVDTLLEAVSDEASYLTAWSDGRYTTNLTLEDVTDRKASVAHELGREPLESENGDSARLPFPHPYFWKSAKWVRGLSLTPDDEPGLSETYGYHDHGDPWLKRRYQGG
jgi:DMSO/TMAO reductase YedYZ molybdopterin-dependent catalytic subunit